MRFSTPFRFKTSDRVMTRESVARFFDPNKAGEPFTIGTVTMPGRGQYQVEWDNEPGQRAWIGRRDLVLVEDAPEKPNAELLLDMTKHNIRVFRQAGQARVEFIHGRDHPLFLKKTDAQVLTNAILAAVASEEEKRLNEAQNTTGADIVSQHDPAYRNDLADQRRSLEEPPF